MKLTRKQLARCGALSGRDGVFSCLGVMRKGVNPSPGALRARQGGCSTPSQWDFPTRFSACLHGLIPYTVVKVVTGAPSVVGSAEFVTLIEVGSAARSTTSSVSGTVRVQHVRGVASKATLIAQPLRCTGCKISMETLQMQVLEYEKRTRAWTMKSNEPRPGLVVPNDALGTMKMTIPGYHSQVTELPIASVRCGNNLVPVVRVGCVCFPSVTPGMSSTLRNTRSRRRTCEQPRPLRRPGC